MLFISIYSDNPNDNFQEIIVKNIVRNYWMILQSEIVCTLLHLNFV